MKNVIGKVLTILFVATLPTLQGCFGSTHSQTAGTGTIPSLGTSRSRIFSSHPLARAFHTEDKSLSTTLSPESLLIGSSLVARIKILDTVATTTHYDFRTDYKAAEILKIIRQSYGPDANTAVNSTIIVTDHLLTDDGGIEFLDDLALHQSEEAVVFLQKLHKTMIYNGKSVSVYRFTAPFVSKYFVNENGTLDAMSVYRTTTKQALAGASSTDLVRSRLSILGVAIQSTAKEPDTVHALLTKVGISDIASYETELTQKPWKLIRELAIRDAKAKNVPIHFGISSDGEHDF